MDVVKLSESKIEGKSELVLDSILTHFGYTDCDLKEYIQNMLKMADKFLGMGHKICGKKYLELAAAKGCPCAQKN